jgi:hypothetical protein
MTDHCVDACFGLAQIVFNIDANGWTQHVSMDMNVLFYNQYAQEKAAAASAASSSSSTGVKGAAPAKTAAVARV